MSLEHITLSLQHHALPTELEDHLIQMYSKLTIFMQWREKLIQIKSEIWSV